MEKLLGTTLAGAQGAEKSTSDALSGKEVVGLYFSAHWCPPCRGFTPKLAEAYKGLVAGNKPIEIVFVSSDRDEAAFSEYFGEMPWLALPYSARDKKNELSKKIQGERHSDARAAERCHGGADHQGWARRDHGGSAGRKFPVDPADAQ